MNEYRDVQIKKKFTPTPTHTSTQTCKHTHTHTNTQTNTHTHKRTKQGLASAKETLQQESHTITL